MKRIILALMVLMSLQGAAQLPDFVPYRSKVKHIGIAADSLFYIPVKDTNYTPARLGAMTMRPQDSCVYVGVRTTTGGKRWERLAKYTDLLGAAGWDLAGNALTAGVDVFGSTNNTSVRLITNNVQRVIFDSTGKVGIGLSAPAFKLDVGGTATITEQTIGINGNPVVFKPYQTVVDGSHWGSLFFGTGGRQETTGRANVSSGDGALDSLTIGIANTAGGLNAMRGMRGGSLNAVFGTNGMLFNRYGDENSVIGVNALYYNKGSFMAVVGTSSFLNCDSCETSTGLGAQSALTIKSANQSNFIGYKTAYGTGSNPEVHFTNAMGYRALEDINYVNGVSVIGQNGFGDLITGDYHTGGGAFVGRNWTGGRASTALGAFAGVNALQKLDPIHQTTIGAYAYGTRDFSLVLGSKDSTNVTELNGKDTLIVDANLTTIKNVTSSGTYTGRWKARVGSTTSSGTPTINTDNVDIYKLTAQAADITSFTTNLSGTPNDGDILEIQITGTATRAITWGSAFVSSTVSLPTTTVGTATLTVVVQYFSNSSYGNNKYVCVNSF